MRSYESYHHFDEDIHEAVARAASDQDKLSFAELADHYNLDDAVRITEYEGRPIQSVTFTPEGDYDETHAQIYHVPFAISLDPNTLMRLMRQHAANPSEQLISYSNPGTIGQPGGKLKAADLWHIARTHDLSPVVAPQQADLNSRGITSVDRLGYSAGTLQALAAMEHDDNVETRAGILVEPVAVAKQGLLKLARSFMNSGSEVWNYINQTDSQPYTDVRSKKMLGIDTGLINYSIGIGRATNLVSAREMARGGIYDRAYEALRHDYADSLTFAWGTESEISKPELTALQIAHLQERYGNRVHAMELEGMHHAGGDDINLHALIMTQALHDARSR